MTKKKISLLLISLAFIVCSVFAITNIKPLNSFADTGITYSYSYDASKGSNWINAEVNLPNELVKDGVADMSNIKAMVYEVDNSNQPAFCYTLGIWDKDHTNFDDQWHMDNTGSALFVPEYGHPFWASTHWVPAGFKGTVVIPWSTTTYDWSDATKYKVVNNPVFKTRHSKNTQVSNREYGKGYYYIDGSQGTFPTARMDTKMTFYVHNDWNTGTANITFNNIRFVENYDSYLQQAAAYDTESIGTQSNQITMENAIAFNSSTYIAPTYKLQSGGGTSVTSLDNNVGLAIRIKNMSSKALNLEVKINESSSEMLFISHNNVIDFPFIHTDGRVEYIRAGIFGMAIPENSDGTVIIPNVAWALSQNPNKPADLNGRLNGNMWALLFFAHDIGVEQTFAIAEINQIYANYNTSTSKTEYTLKPMKTATSGTDVNYVKNLNSWQRNGANLYVLGDTSSVNLTENIDGATSTENLVNIDKTSVYYRESLTLSMTVKTGRVVESVLVNGQEKVTSLVDGDGVKTLTIVNDKDDGTAIEIVVNYKTAFYVTYELDGGINDSRNPTMYDKTNKGETAILVYPAVKANYRFLGWFNRVEFSHPDAFKITALDYDFFTSKGYSDADIKLYAAYVTDYTVNVVDGEKSTEVNIAMGSALHEEDLVEFIKDGYIAKYYLDSEFTTEVTFPYYANAHDTNVYVKYEPISYSVRYSSLGGTQINGVTVKYGETVSKPNDPIRDGYRFDGWFTSDDYETEFDFTKGINANTVVYAKWTYVKDSNTAKTLTTVIIINSVVTLLGAGGIVTLFVLKRKK